MLAMTVAFSIVGCPSERDFLLVRTIAEEGAADGQVKGPACITHTTIADTVGSVILVADEMNDRVAIWRDEGMKFLRNLTTINGSDSALSGPRCVSTSPQMTKLDQLPSVDSLIIYIADSKNHRVVVCDIMGNLIRSWGGVGTDSGKFDRLTGITVDFSGNVFIVDSGANKVQMFDPSGAFIRSWGGTGSSVGQFKNPIDITLRFPTRPNRIEILVTDHGNNRVQVFDTLGNVLRLFEGIIQPLGIDAINDLSDDYAFVISGLGDLVKLSGDGIQLRFIPLKGAGRPYDVDAGGLGIRFVQAFVTDRSGHRILFFDGFP